MRFVSGDIAAFVRALKDESGKDVWLVGGGQINTTMLNAGLIDELILTVFPSHSAMAFPYLHQAPRAPASGPWAARPTTTGLIQWRLVKE